MSHLLAAVSGQALEKTVQATIKDFDFAYSSGTKNLGPFTASVDVEAGLQSGLASLRDDNTIALTDVEILFKKLDLTIGVDFGELCTPTACISIPLDGTHCLPQLCVHPAFSIPLHLDGFITSEVSVTAGVEFRYAVDPGRDPALTPWEAEENGKPNKWQLFVKPTRVHIELFDFAASVRNLLQEAIDAAVNDYLAPLPGWAKDLIRLVLGDLADAIRGVLDLPDAVEEWLAQKIGGDLSVEVQIETAIAEYFASRAPVLAWSDPLPLPFLKSTDHSRGLTVKIPLANPSVQISATEMVVQVDIGG